MTPLYENEVSKTKGLSDCICAYRKIPIGKGSLANAKKAAYSIERKKGKSNNSMIHKGKLFNKFSHLGSKGSKNNFVSYARQAAEVMQEDAIKKQLSQSWNNLNKEIKKYEEKHKLKTTEYLSASLAPVNN
ncbi:MAG TPA: hypothetical protein VK543_02475 [Puia sp.]|nr:hypothetical protein [Puia sp.]